MVGTTLDNRFGTTRFIVDASGANGSYTTIQAAITAATGPATIFVRPGTYIENITLKANVDVTAYAPNSSGVVVIRGTVTYDQAGANVKLSGIRFQTNSALIVSYQGSSAQTLTFENCSFICRSATPFDMIQNSNSSTGSLQFFNCILQGLTGNKIIDSTGTATIVFSSSTLFNSTTASTVSSSATIQASNSSINTPFSLSGTANFDMFGGTYSLAATFLTLATGTTANLYNARINTGAQSIASITSTGILSAQNCILESANANTVTGTGTFREASCSYPSTRNPNSSTVTKLSETIKSIANGGTASTSFNTYGPVVAGATSTSALTSVSPSATSGVPLISQGAAANPAFGTAVVAGGGTGITTTTAYAPICAGTTATGAFQQATTGFSTSGYVLTSNGSSALPSFQATGATSFQVVIQTFTGNGTYTPTAGMKFCIVEVIGGGGGGGGAVLTGAGVVSAGGGGGGGGYSRNVFSAATIGASQTVTIGTAGTAGSTAGGNGGTGGNTTFGALLTGVGGGGGNGTAAAAATIGVNGGGAGGGIGGSFNCEGNGGGWAYGAATGLGGVLTGAGGATVLGGSRPGGLQTLGSNGQSGLAYGGGGSGGGNAPSQATGKTGGAGGAGLCTVTEYVLVSATIVTTLPWTEVTAATQALAVNNGYVTNRGGGVTYTLPASGAVGDVIRISGKSGISTVNQNANQQIVLASASTTVGITGSIASTNTGDCIELICTTGGTSTVWRANGQIGVWSVT